MESPVLQNSVEKKSKKKLFLSLAIAFFVLAIGFLLIVVFTYGKSNVKSPAPTFSNEDNTPVSAPSVTVKEPTPAMPSDNQSNLTKYTFDADYGFNMMYDASKWEITTEPQQVYESVNTSVESKYALTLQPIGNHSAANEFTVYMKKMLVSAESGNIQLICSADYKILKEQSNVGADGSGEQPQNAGLIRVYVQGNGYAYAHFWYHNADKADQLCINVGRGIYATESVPGGEGVAGGDTNDIYWVALAVTGPSNPYIADVDQMVSTLKFKGQ